jgi:hypothetical protein
MGGAGSGWGGRGSRYLTVEQCYDLDLAELAKVGFFRRRDCKVSCPWTWTTRGGHRDGQVTTVQVEIDFRPDPSRYGDAPRFAILYGTRPTDGSSPEEALGVRGNMTTTEPRYGGVRYWWECPQCWRRCRVLYAYPAQGRERFMCRRCQGLRYYVHNESHPDRLHRRARKLYRRAGSRDGSEPWQKPKWMRWTTFSRLVPAGRDAEETADGMMLASLSAGLASIQSKRPAAPPKGARADWPL